MESDRSEGYFILLINVKPIFPILMRERLQNALRCYLNGIKLEEQSTNCLVLI